RNEASEKAVDQVRLRYVMIAIADAENIKVEESEISTEVIRMAIQQRRDATEFRKELESKGNLPLVADQLRFVKTLDRLLELAKIK
ncbi:MAG: hypothetical protein FJ220_01720, partial [Kiritimatiellaceae bacterium]|nr:hypothetical protein [Kiritimatiellaceae bacterium]